MYFSKAVTGVIPTLQGKKLRKKTTKSAAISRTWINTVYMDKHIQTVTLKQKSTKLETIH